MRKLFAALSALAAGAAVAQMPPKLEPLPDVPPPPPAVRDLGAEDPRA